MREEAVIDDRKAAAVTARIAERMLSPNGLELIFLNRSRRIAEGAVQVG
ncbi:MAG: hypothetical protein JW884_12120 [Deltaproteobacteria bacterium]|nr:hypothetical protein [Deltaproteobacteria bacterium]